MPRACVCVWSWTCWYWAVCSCDYIIRCLAAVRKCAAMKQCMISSREMKRGFLGFNEFTQSPLLCILQFVQPKFEGRCFGDSVSAPSCRASSNMIIWRWDVGFTAHIINDVTLHGLEVKPFFDAKTWIWYCRRASNELAFVWMYLKRQCYAHSVSVWSINWAVFVHTCAGCQFPWECSWYWSAMKLIHFPDILVCIYIAVSFFHRHWPINGAWLQLPQLTYMNIIPSRGGAGLDIKWLAVHCLMDSAVPRASKQQLHK